MTGDSARLTIALCASVFAHAWLIATHPGGPSVRPPAFAAGAPISARLAVNPLPDTENTVENAPGERRVVPARQERIAESIPAVPTRPAEAGRVANAAISNPAPRAEKSISTADSPKLPATVDTTWYTAQDIDSYPVAAASLRLAPSGGATAARLLLWLRIDEHGAVVEVSAGEPGIPDAWVEAARASLAAIRFRPAFKDGRAVRSRLLLSVSFADRD